MISGLGDDELEWVMKESGSRFMTELDYDFWTDLDKAITDESATHSYDENLREIDEILTKEMDEAELNNIPKGTKAITDGTVKQFKNFLSNHNFSTNIEEMPVSYLANYLRFFILT